MLEFMLGAELFDVGVVPARPSLAFICEAAAAAAWAACDDLGKPNTNYILICLCKHAHKDPQLQIYKYISWLRNIQNLPLLICNSSQLGPNG